MRTKKINAKIGDLVRLSREAKRNWLCPKERENNVTAIIQSELPGIPGAFSMQQDLSGCRYWNNDDLIVVRPGKKS